MRGQELAQARYGVLLANHHSVTTCANLHGSGGAAVCPLQSRTRGLASQDARAQSTCAQILRLEAMWSLGQASQPLSNPAESTSPALVQVREIWLSSEDTGAWGLDLGTSIPALLDRLTQELPATGHAVLRLGMTNPPYILQHLPAIAQVYWLPSYRVLFARSCAGTGHVLGRKGGAAGKYHLVLFGHVPWAKS